MITPPSLRFLVPERDPHFKPELAIRAGSILLNDAGPAAVLLEGMGAQIGPDPGRPENPYPAGQCTWGVWQYVADHFGVYMPDLPGNATDWVDDAKQRGWTVTSDVTANTVVCWSNSKYPPFGHVAFVTGVDRGTTSLIGGIVGTEQSKPVTFTVDEYNFSHPLQHDTRTITANSPNDAAGIRGFIQVPGVTPGAKAGTQVDLQATDPWSEFNAGISSIEQQAMQQIQQVSSKLAAGAQIGAGLVVLAGGGLLTVLALRSPQTAQNALRGAGQLPGRLISRTRRTAVPAAQEAVLGPAPVVAGGRPGRVTAAGRMRVLPR